MTHEDPIENGASHIANLCYEPFDLSNHPLHFFPCGHTLCPFPPHCFSALDGLLVIFHLLLLCLVSSGFGEFVLKLTKVYLCY